MADQEFLASFKVEIDETGLERLKEALTTNQALTEDLAAAFDAARDAVSRFFAELSSATLSTGELSPYSGEVPANPCGINKNSVSWRKWSVLKIASEGQIYQIMPY